MKHLRVNGTEGVWRAKLVEEYDLDDKHHKQAICNLMHDLSKLAVVRNYYIDRDTITNLYDLHTSYQQGEMK